ncbi:hypothetical protein BDZ89DRAFT_1131074 [Hymenopellis radicata]|nr:hypothetical protein BDZ89DRAFT_1131074 [Hymenopellis radicata]
MAAMSFTSSSTWQPPAHWNLTNNNASFVKKVVKKKLRTQEEETLTSAIAARVSARLAEDHTAVTSPQVDTPFVDAVDVVKRLLPYHVFQQPKEDLDAIIHDVKGKRKATEHDLREEVKETRFALDCFKRRAELEKRFRKIRTKSGRRSAPDDQCLFIAQSVLDSDRAENSIMNSEMKSLRNEYDKMEREKRSSLAAQRTSYYQAQQIASASPAPLTRQPYYHSYPYNYAYGTPGTSTFSIPLSSAVTSHTTGVTPVTVPVVSASTATPTGASTTPVPISTPTGSSTPVAATTTATANTGYRPTAGAVPVQLPVTSLPTLATYGIVPVAATGPGQQVNAPAVLRGSSANGTKLHLEFNVAQLTQAQRDGLVSILNSMMTKGDATNGKPAGS